ncbi:MAG: hypothetical protein Q8L06_10760 [Pseudohongiella sp.]|nr:hypothetical protein [Pseudohongiella sp.]
MNRSIQIAVGTLAIALMGITAMPLQAQLPSHLRDYPLAAPRASGDIVAPMFNGWIANKDGSTTYIFGFANRNTQELVDVPLGRNNRIEPAQFDGAQPTHFPSYSRGGFVGIQERGVFAVTIPPEMKGTEVVWTLTHAGHSYSVPARATSPAYEMSLAPAAFGSLSPAIRFEKNGAESVDRVGIQAPRISTSVGKPVTLTAFIQDRGERGQYLNDVDPIYPLGTEWILHQGPAHPHIEQPRVTGRERSDEGGEGSFTKMSPDGWTEVSTLATFPAPGDYLIRLRVDNFAAPDSQFDNQCCWSNAYVPVTVTP